MEKSTSDVNLIQNIPNKESFYYVSKMFRKFDDVICHLYLIWVNSYYEFVFNLNTEHFQPKPSLQTIVYFPRKYLPCWSNIQ